MLIDEPGSGLPGYGPSLPQMLCTTPLTGCPASVGSRPARLPPANHGCRPGTATPAPNVYQGVLPAATSANRSVTFFGVPVLPPTTTGSRVFRITNVRVDATPLIGGSASGAIAGSGEHRDRGATSLSITNPTPIVGFVTRASTASASSAANLNQCSTQTKTAVNTLTFTENFGTAFKTRVAAQTQHSVCRPDRQPGALPERSRRHLQLRVQLRLPGATAGSGTAGLADFGTRLKATFNNIPSGARIFVSTSNVNNAAFPVTAAPAVDRRQRWPTPTPRQAPLCRLRPARSTVKTPATATPAPPASSRQSPATDNGPNNGNVPIAEVSIDPTSKSGTAVWEAVNTNPNTPESFKFAVYVTYIARSPRTPRRRQFALSTSPSLRRQRPACLPARRAFRGSLVISHAASTIFTINICRTILLYPYITNQAGFDTGLTIANTSQDSIVPVRAQALLPHRQAVAP